MRPSRNHAALLEILITLLSLTDCPRRCARKGVLRHLCQINIVDRGVIHESLSTATIAHTELQYFTNLALLLNHAIHTDTKGTRISQLIYVGTHALIVCAEGVQLPGFTGEPGENTALNIR